MTSSPSSASSASIESFLSVPLEFILTRAILDDPSFSDSYNMSKDSNKSQRQQRPLLLRSEAWSLLKVNLISSEIDSLISYCIKKLSKVGNFRKQIEDIYQTNKKQHYFIAMLPLLHTLQQNSISSLEYITHQISECFEKLNSLEKSIRQFSEQNLGIAEQLSEMNMDDSNIVMQEKKFVGTVELEVCNRIEILFESMNGPSENVFDLFNVQDGSTFVSMKEFCSHAFASSKEDIGDEGDEEKNDVTAVTDDGSK